MEIYEVSNAFGIIVSRHKHLRGMRAFDLADRADISYSYCYELMSGNRNPTLYVAVSIAHALNLSISELLDGLEDLI